MAAVPLVALPVPGAPAVLGMPAVPAVLRGSPVMMRASCEMPLRWGNATISVWTVRIGNQNESWGFR
ncbi:hypothetical protein GCM10010502_40860 [Kitasatospora aureofaciens]|uniref:Uncharacterized protein n=1 Tax=Kitasatospora aureofaciens TaxID=1894 RepID=A0A8H9HT45_KITAU|nr:hypothetical protein GCM10010502_40860 [Kitasatospora aureofaciens]